MAERLRQEDGDVLIGKFGDLRVPCGPSKEPSKKAPCQTLNGLTHFIACFCANDRGTSGLPPSANVNPIVQNYGDPCELSVNRDPNGFPMKRKNSKIQGPTLSLTRTDPFADPNHFMPNQVSGNVKSAGQFSAGAS
jgi:hypothetical protein